MRRTTAVIIAVALATGACAAKKPPPPPPPVVMVSKPLKSKIVDWDDFVGRFEAVSSVDVRPRVSGYLKTIAFKDGQNVKAGQLLFVIDPRPYQAALAQAKGQEAHAVAALNNGEVELARAKNLLAARAISDELYQTRLATAQQAAADLVAARANVASAQLNLNFTRVTAPLSGRISDRRIAVGNLVTQDTTILTNITDLNPIRFIFDGAEALYLKYERQGQAGQRQPSRVYPNPVEIRLQDQSNYVIHGRMDFVDNALDPNSGTIRGRAVVTNDDGILTPGMFGHLRLLGSGAYDGLLVPDEAVVAQQSDQIIFVVGQDGKVEQHKVKTGPLFSGLRVIRSGITENDEVVIEGVQRAKTGLKVTARAGRITPPDPKASPTGPDIEPPASSATFAAPGR